MTHQLISQVFYPAFRNPLLEQDHDGCVFPMEEGRLAYSTDSFVVDPIFFPGGDIGDLAINGTVNDLACCGARPLYLTAGFILEEGLPLADLQRIVQSMKRAAERAGVQIVAGDTKVVERGKCDKLFINTSGIGIVPPGFETDLKSDTASLNILISELLHTIGEVHVLRDPTRGGVSGTLNEIAQDAGVDILLDEDALPIPEAVRAASEMLGLDTLYIANEGLVLVILPESLAEQALPLMRRFEEGRQATVIGRITKQSGEQARVKMKTLYGNYRIIDMLSGEQLPRIC